MRAKIAKKDSRIIKKLRGTPFLFEQTLKNLKPYEKWLQQAGFKTPNTSVSYVDGQIVFNQQFIESVSSTNIEQIIVSIKKLSFETYGLDSNPGNFLDDTRLYFIDFSPMLTRNIKVLEEQFDYPPQEALQRYFTLENILIFYIVRLFKENATDAMKALKCSKETLIQSYDNILPREKIRLLKALKLMKSNKLNGYKDLYISSKKSVSISTSEDKELLQKITYLK